jgi:hypothetical protein
VVWTVIPLIIVMVIFAWGWRGSLDMTMAPPDALTYQAMAQQWSWSIKHPNHSEPVNNEIWVPLGRRCKFVMSSADVLHSFFLPAMRVKRDVLPGRYQIGLVRGDEDGNLPPVLRRVLRRRPLEDGRRDPRGRGRRVRGGRAEKRYQPQIDPNAPAQLPEPHQRLHVVGGTLDHKRIGLMYLVGVTHRLPGGGLFALLVRLHLWEPTACCSSNATYNQIFTLHGAFMVFLFVIPAIPGSLGNMVLPLMLGAKDVALPRLNLLSFYLWLTGALLATLAIVLGGFDTGWTFYTPYSLYTKKAGRHDRPGVFMLGFSSIFTGLNFIVTTHKLRAPGMTWFRMPLFVWALYATSLLQVLATPVLGITVLLLASSASTTSASSIRASAATRCCSSTSSGSTATRPSTS